MNVKLRILTAGVLFFTGQALVAQQDSTKTQNIEEVVVVGYGTQKKADVTSSITTVKGSDIANLNTPTFEAQLAGRASGVQVVSSSGDIGRAPTVRIRGVNTITSGTSPLYVVDGVPIFAGDTGGGNTYTNALADINPADIESMTVLKDGAATAIYGSRAANGVVLITTKKGKNGKFTVSYNNMFSVASVVKKLDLLETPDFLTISNEKAKAAGTVWAKGSDYNTDWQKAVLRAGTQTDHFLSMTGGLGKGNYYASLGYTKQEGVITPNAMERISLRMNADQKVTDWFKLSTNFAYSETSYKGLNNGYNSISGAMFSAVRQLPNTPIYDTRTPTGYNIYTQGTVSRVGQWDNLIPITSDLTNIAYVVNNNKYTSDLSRFIGSIAGDVKITDWLDYKLQVSKDRSVTTGFLYWNRVHGDGFSRGGYIDNNYLNLDRWNIQNILNFNKTFGSHNLNVVLVNEYQKQKTNSFFADGQGLSSDFFGDVGVISGSYATQYSGGGATENGLISYAARLSYNFANKYFVQGTIRRDGLSSLPTANKWGNFPGVSLGWTVSNEGFMKDLNTLSELKLRASYGKVGNTDIGNYPYLGLYNSFKYADYNGIGYSQAGNDQLKWETNTKKNLGADFGLLKNRITFSADYFVNENDGLILAVPLSPSLGVPGNSVNKNIGSMENRGFEFSANADILKNENLKWSIGGNLTLMDNKVTGLVDGKDIIQSQNGETAYLIREGESLRSLYGYKYWGVNAANGNPVYYKADGSLVQANIANQGYYLFDPTNPGNLGTASSLTNDDRQILGNTLPTYFGSVNTTLQYKRFDFSVMARFSGGNNIFNVTRRELLNQDFYNNGSEILGRWQSASNPGDGWTPKLHGGRGNFINLNGQATSRFVEKGDFVKIDNITLGYSLDPAMLSSINLTKFRIYGVVQNAIMFTNYKGIDPEMENLGMDYNAVPRQRTISFGINATF
ncbi:MULTISPECIES: SusC/RagA family TonB-linked outer membrane protein [Chryseobacterium]|uniref:TonB-dependent receptor SusC n=1 Tax=Chryseobacterium salivictor TaxID=2547600 RepID=A0A4P6ZD48_9FLAO|nr:MULTISPECIES: SusC/RagA family TonB-linked outer membrane protein [Chryseobacterium]MDQ0476564.1 TonB-linked SusC/RagA family outer membrane protein [Chryseobacterium sp. MDT2-18]QBO57470.1 TonB-dependent receptor SusC [Chryseobacterium salivictor]